MNSRRFATLLTAFTSLATLPFGLAQTVDWDGGVDGAGNSLSVITNWNPDLTAAADLTGKTLRIATANFAPGFVPTTSTGMGNILIGAAPAVAGFQFDNTGNLYRLNFGVRIVPTTSTTTTTDRVITLNTAGTIISATNNASASIRRFATNVGASGDIATVIVNLAYTGTGIIHVDATSSFLFQEIKITGTGGITKTGPGTLTLDSGFFSSLSAPPNLTINTVYEGSTADNYSGGLTILDGVVSVDSVTRLPGSTLNNDGVTENPDAVILDGGTLRFSGGTLGSSANRGFRLGDATGTLNITAANTRIIGSFRNVPGEAGVLIKSGTGNLSLEGSSHTFSGGTQLQSGTLTLNGTTLGDPDGLGLSVSANATLRGHGTVNGNASFADGATIAPATYASNVATSVVGTLSFAKNVTLGNVALAYDLDTPSTSDLLTLASGATLDIGTGTLDLSDFTFTPGAGYAPGIYPLITTASPVTGTLGATLTGTLGGQEVSLGLNEAGTSLQLTVGTPAPSDTTPPVITLEGAASVALAWGDSYTELGATVTDNAAPFTAPVVITVTPGGSVDTAKPGVYVVAYNATDVAGNPATTVTRNVTVAIATPTITGADGLSPLMKYAFGANAPGDPVQVPILSSTAASLSLTAVVRTNDPAIIVTGEAVNELTGTWGTGGTVTVTAAADQTNLPANCVRRVFTVDTTSATRKFLRLNVTGTP